MRGSGPRRGVKNSDGPVRPSERFDQPQDREHRHGPGNRRTGHPRGPLSRSPTRVSASPVVGGARPSPAPAARVRRAHSQSPAHAFTSRRSSSTGYRHRRILVLRPSPVARQADRAVRTAIRAGLPAATTPDPAARDARPQVLVAPVLPGPRPPGEGTHRRRGWRPPAGVDFGAIRAPQGASGNGN